MSGPLERLRQRLTARGLAPRKALGQNFLADRNFATAVAREARAGRDALVLEVGPGAGALTGALLEADPDARVLAIELDHGLASLMRDEFAERIAAGRLTLLDGDVLDGKHGLHAGFVAEALRISRDERRPRRVLCANLPYNAATPLVANLAMPLGTAAAAGSLLAERIVVTIQLELAERFLARAGSAAYGGLSVLLALRGEGEIVRKAGPEVFWPRPKVSSAVVVYDFVPWRESMLRLEEAAGFQAFLQRLFQHRRKTLRAGLKHAGIALNPDDPRGGMRAEELSPADLLELFRELIAATGH